VFQRRLDGSVDFYRGWSDYKNGFGSTNGEFWLGNENIHSLTSNGNYVLRIDLEAFDGETRFAEYTDFLVDSESTNYTL
ncbi:Ficolin-2, partial [Lamellibrachia satsuma]